MQLGSHGTHTHTHTHEHTLPGWTVPLWWWDPHRAAPLISPRLLCPLSRPAPHEEPVFNMAAHPGPTVTINFTFNCQQVLITGITAALNVGFLLIFLPVKKGKQTQRDKYHPPPLNRNILWSSQSHFHHLQIWCGSQKEGGGGKPQFRWMWTITMGFFFCGRLLPPTCNWSFHKEPSAGLLFGVPRGSGAAANQAG